MYPKPASVNPPGIREIFNFLSFLQPMRRDRTPMSRGNIVILSSLFQKINWKWDKFFKWTPIQSKPLFLIFVKTSMSKYSNWMHPRASEISPECDTVPSPSSSIMSHFNFLSFLQRLTRTFYSLSPISSFIISISKLGHFWNKEQYSSANKNTRRRSSCVIRFAKEVGIRTGYSVLKV